LFSPVFFVNIICSCITYGYEFFQHVVCSIVPYRTKFSLLLLLFVNCTCSCFESVHKRMVRDCSKTQYLLRTGCRETSTAQSLLYHRQDRHRHTVGAGSSWPASFVDGEAASSGLPLHWDWRPSRVAWFLERRDRPVRAGVVLGGRSRCKRPLPRHKNLRAAWFLGKRRPLWVAVAAEQRPLVAAA
jgi:hypothetical protein